MKVRQEEDRFGNYPLVFKGYKDIREVHEWLWDNYQGYHFVIILDETKDEYEEIERDIFVYFTDEVIHELAGQCDMMAIPRQPDLVLTPLSDLK